MKKYREEKGLRIQGTLSITIVEASRTTIEGNADLKRGSFRTGFVLATVEPRYKNPRYKNTVENKCRTKSCDVKD